MDMTKRDELQEQIKAILEPKLKEKFIVGMKAGYDAAMLHIYKATKDMTSAKKIQRYIKQKVDEGAARHLAKEADNE